METVTLTPKVVLLRLDLEQVQHITDGLVKNREDIAPEYLGLYDGKVNDLLGQLRQQGIQVITEND